MVLVVDPCGDRRHMIVEALAETGWPVREASTPLEAIDFVVHDAEVAAVAIAQSTRCQTRAEELAAFLADEHPALRVALIPDDRDALGPALRDLLARL